MQRKGLIAIFIVLVACSIGIAFAVGRDDHDALIRDALGKLAIVSSVTGTARLETIAVLPLDEAGEETLRLPIALVGPAQVRIPPAGTITGAVDMVAGLAEEEFADTDVRMRWVAVEDGSTYARFERLPDLAMTGVNLRSFNDTWFILTPPIDESYRGQLRFVSGTGRGTAVLALFDPLRAMFAEGRLVASADQMVSEVIDGIPTRHYRLHIRRGDLEEFLTAARGNALGRGLLETEIRTIQALWDDNDIRVEVWIDRHKREVKRLGFDLRPHLGNPEAPVRFVLDVDAYDAPVDVQPPPDAMSLEEFVERLVGAGADAQ